MKPETVALIAGGVAALILFRRPAPAARDASPGAVGRLAEMGATALNDAWLWAEPGIDRYAENSSVGVRTAYEAWDWLFAPQAPGTPAANYAENASAGVRAGFDFWNWLTR